MRLEEVADGVWAWVHPVGDRFAANVGVVLVEDVGVCFTGDLCTFGRVPLAFSADLDAWRASVGELAGRAHTFVPGHGPLGGAADVALVGAYLAAVGRAAATGDRLEPGPWDGWHDPWAERVPAAAHRLDVEQAAIASGRASGVPPTLLALVAPGER